MEKGLRFIVTFGCSQHCSFCYQARLRNDRTELGVDRMKKIMNELMMKNEYDYVTFMGGEVVEVNNIVDYIKAARSVFNGRINVTSNGRGNVDVYEQMFKNGVNHLNLSSLDRFDVDLIKKIKTLKTAPERSLRLNIFLPAVNTSSTTLFETAKRYYGEAIKCGVQVNLLYDYREEFKDYDDATESALASGRRVDPSLRITTKGNGYLITNNESGYVVWIDINYKKTSEDVVTPYGEVARGFEYMETR